MAARKSVRIEMLRTLTAVRSRRESVARTRLLDRAMNSVGVPWADGSSGQAKCPHQNRRYARMI